MRIRKRIEVTEAERKIRNSRAVSRSRMMRYEIVSIKTFQDRYKIWRDEVSEFTKNIYTTTMLAFGKAKISNLF